MASERLERVNELIRQQVGLLLVREVEFPLGVVVTVMRVKTDADIKKTRVFVSVTPKEYEKGALSLLIKRRPFLQSELNHSLEMKFVPALAFSIEREDEKQDQADEAEHILDQLKNES